jgi:hypothetical protein
MWVTGMPEGFFTPLEAQPAMRKTAAAPQRGTLILLNNGFILLKWVEYILIK